MKPAPQSNLEKLIEAQDALAEQEAEAEQEAAESKSTSEPVTLEYSATIGYQEREDVKDLTDLIYAGWMLQNSIREDEIGLKANKNFWRMMAGSVGAMTVCM